MFDFFRKNLKTIFTATLVTFVASIFIGFGGYLWTGGAGLDTIAIVNNSKITARRFTQHYFQTIEQLRQQNVEITEEVLNQKRIEVLHDLIREEVFYQEAKKYGIYVGDRELSFNISQMGMFQRDGKFDPGLYHFIVRRLGMTPREFEEMNRKFISGMKVRNFIANTILLTENELPLTPPQDKKIEDLQKEIFEQKRNAILTEYFRQLQNNMRVRVYETRLNQLSRR